MSKLWITCYARLGRDDRGTSAGPELPELETIVVDATATVSEASTVLPAQTRHVRLVAEAAGGITIGTAPVATVDDNRLVAGDNGLFGIPEGPARLGTLKIAYCPAS